MRYLVDGYEFMESVASQVYFISSQFVIKVTIVTLSCVQIPTGLQELTADYYQSVLEVGVGPQDNASSSRLHQDIEQVKDDMYRISRDMHVVEMASRELGVGLTKPAALPTSRHTTRRTTTADASNVVKLTSKKSSGGSKLFDMIDIPSYQPNVDGDRQTGGAAAATSGTGVLKKTTRGFTHNTAGPRDSYTGSSLMVPSMQVGVLPVHVRGLKTVAASSTTKRTIKPKKTTTRPR